MQWINDTRGYGWLTIALHWFGVIAIVLLLTTGFRAEFLEEAGDRAGRAAMMGWHIGIGASVWLLFLARVLTSYLQPRPASVEQPRPLQWLAAATHHMLLAAILLQIVSGPLAIWSGGRAIDVFGVFAIPSPFAARNEGVHEFAELLHAIGRWTIIVAGSLHVVAVIKHAVDRRGVLRRMLSPPARA